MRKFIIFGLALIFLCGIVSAKYKLIEVQVNSKNTLAEAAGLGLEIISYDKLRNVVEVAADEAGMTALQNTGLVYSEVISDLEAFYSNRLGAVEDMGGYHTYDETVDYLAELYSNYPNIVSIPFSIGQSIEGRDLWLVKISDNPEIDEEEPEIFYNGLIHAREPITIELLIYFMDYLTQNYQIDPEATYLVDNREMFFLPIINPDGYVRNQQTNPNGGGMWRKNKRDNNNSGQFEPNVDGVDLNRNWGYMWGYDNNGSSPNPGSESYRGTAPFSEPETEAVSDFINTREFSIIMNYHSFGNYILHSWDYDYLYTADHNLFTELGEKMADWNGYSLGTAWEILYLVNGGANDWCYGDSGHSKIIAYVSEVGNDEDGFWPEEARILPLCAENLQPNIVVAEYADNPCRALPPGAPVIAPLDTVTGEFVLCWSIAGDTVNPAAGFEVKELRGKAIVTEDLESDPESNWFMDGFSWVSNEYHSYNHSVYSGAENSSTAIFAAEDYYLAQTGDTLKFWTKYDTEEDYDYAYVMATVDGYIYNPIAGNITTNNNPNGGNIGNGITGNSNGWVEGKFPLAEYEGQNILLVFVYVTDSYVLEEGWYIDDIYPHITFESDTMLAEGIADTFLTVVPGVVEEELYYQVRAFDNEGDYSKWSNLESVYVTGTGTAGRVIPPAGFVFKGVYPNPFNSNLVISFELREAGEVKLGVYDVLGREIQVLGAGDWGQGKYIIVWDASQQGSGVYFIQLNCGRAAVVEKVVLVR